MAHKTRAEQKAMRVRKDPKKLARKTKAHETKTAYKREHVRLDSLMKEYEYVSD